MSSSIAIVGDRFMLPSVFAERISAACGNGVNIRTLEQPWPDKPMEHGYAGSPLDGLKEFMGHPDEVAAYLALVKTLPGFVHLVVPVGKGLSVAYRSGKAL